MRKVAIIGVGMTPVGEHWENSLRSLAADASRLALEDAGLSSVDAIYVSNSYSSTLSSQSHLGTLVADFIGAEGIESYSIEAGEASGGAALRTGILAVASEMIDTALIVGVEKSTDALGSTRTEARNISLDADYEAAHGATLPALAALLMRRYMYEYHVPLEAFEGFTINAHANGKLNPNAMFRNAIKSGVFAKSAMIADPVGLFDSAPDADGAAAIILAPADRAADMIAKPINILASSGATDTLALHDRRDPLNLKAANLSASKAYRHANLTPDDIDLFELHDGFTILCALTLEATGFAVRGEGWKLAADSGKLLNLKGQLPISTFGGLKSRGNPVGAAGIYQAVEATLQLRGEAGQNQVENARIAMIQNLGGLASTAFTHIFGATV